MRIDGEQNPTWEDVTLKVMISPKQPIDVAVQRGSDILEKKIRPEPEGSDQYGTVGWLPEQPVIVTELEPDMPAAKAGIQLGDDLVSVDGTQVRSVYSMIHFLQQNGDKPVEVAAVRKGQNLTFTMTPVQTDEGGTKAYRLGFRAEPVHVDKLPFTTALSRSLEENKKYSLLMVDLIHKMVEKKVSIKQLDGPIGIARAWVRRRVNRAGPRCWA